MKSWRDVYKVHPAADLFPMLPEDELRKLGDDIKANGLKEPITLWSPGDGTTMQVVMRNETDDGRPVYVLDGRNRLDAMELVGLKTLDSKNCMEAGYPRNTPKHVCEFSYGQPWIDPYAYVISKNIHRRHLTKEQQADLIVQVMKLKQAADDLARAEKLKTNDLAKTARSFSPEKGKRGGSTKDRFKEKVVEEAKKHDISKRTAEKAIAKDKGPTHEKAREKTPSPEPSPKPSKNVDDIARKVISFLEKEMQGASSADFVTLRDVLQYQLVSFFLGHGVKRTKGDDFLFKLALQQTASLEEKIKRLQADLDQRNTFNSFSNGINTQGIDMDWLKLRRELSKKYHPDRNSNKTFTASEVMADINPLLTRLSGLPVWHT